MTDQELLKKCWDRGVPGDIMILLKSRLCPRGSECIALSGGREASDGRGDAQRAERPKGEKPDD